MLYHTKQRKGPRNPWPEATRARALELVSSGKTSAEASKELGVPQSTVDYWRRGAGLTGYLKAEARRGYVRDHAHEQTDREMAAHLGMSPDTVQVIRRRLGLPAFRVRARSLTPADYPLVARLAAEGSTQLEIAELLGTHQTVISRYQDEYKIKPCARDLKPCRSWAVFE